MAGITKIYVIGGLGGFQGADGVNPIQMQIWVGDGNRQWLEPHYVDPSIKPLGAIKTIIPAKPDDPHSLIDACIAFFPKHFDRCPSMKATESLLENITLLDFHLEQNSIPETWSKLREEAQTDFCRLNIFEALLRPVSKKDYFPK